MKRPVLASVFALVLCTPQAWAQQPSAEGPYKILKTARVGGEGGTDYIYADVVGRRLYIPRGAVRADTVSGRAAVPARITVFNLDDLSPLGEMLTAPNSQGNGVAVDPKSGHGFSSSRPGVTMFDTKTMQLIKSIPLDSGFAPDGIHFDPFNDRVYVFSHPTQDAMAIDSKTGDVIGRIPLGGVPEQAVPDGKGLMYVVLQDRIGGVAVVDVRAMKTTAKWSFVDKGGCNGLSLDDRNKVLFASCGRSGVADAAAPAAAGGAPAQAGPPMMVVMSARDGSIITTLPLAGSSDGGAFSPQTMEAFSTHGNGTLTVVKEKSPTSFEVEQNLNTMNGARTIAFDSKTGHIFVMSVERGPAPPPQPGAAPGGRGPQAPVIPGSFTILRIGK